MSDLTRALDPVVEALEGLGVGYSVCGSVVSSAHGVARATLDVVLVAALAAPHVAGLVAALEAAYYVDLDAARDGVVRRSMFNAIHLATMLKVDVYVLSDRAFDRMSFSRRARGTLEPGSLTTYFLDTPEDTVLHKLEWYRAGGEVSERQWARRTRKSPSTRPRFARPSLRVIGAEEPIRSQALSRGASRMKSSSSRRCRCARQGRDRVHAARSGSASGGGGGSTTAGPAPERDGHQGEQQQGSEPGAPVGRGAPAAAVATVVERTAVVGVAGLQRAGVGAVPDVVAVVIGVARIAVAGGALVRDPIDGGLRRSRARRAATRPLRR